MISAKEYAKWNELMEMVEDYMDLKEAEKRLKDPNAKYIPFEKILKENNLTLEDL